MGSEPGLHGRPFKNSKAEEPKFYREGSFIKSYKIYGQHRDRVGLYVYAAGSLKDGMRRSNIVL